MHVVSTHPSDHRHTNALKAALKDIDAPGWAVVFGDRHEMCVEALRLHYEGVKLVHVGGGDTPHGTDSHPDHRTRDAISMLARVHCVANEFAADNLAGMLVNPEMLLDYGEFLSPQEYLSMGAAIYVTGSPGLDEVVAYAKTLDPNRKREGVFEWFPEVCQWQSPKERRWYSCGKRLPPAEFLHRLAHCELFITSSSSGLYEAPILGTPVELKDNRQAGRRGPYHHPEGRACEAIRKVIEDVCVYRS